jgi:predicted N-acetyltransferase YhbS
MVKSRFMSPRDITQAEILAICKLKNQSWLHSLKSQLAWWENNTDEDDLFVTLVCSDSILAFLRLRSRKVSVSGEKIDALCVTEVCVDTVHQGEGLGMLLMDKAATRIEQTSSGIAYLLCRDAQEPFYTACGWRRTSASLQIESLSGQGRRFLAANERCMTFGPQTLLSRQIVLFGDVF